MPLEARVKSVLSGDTVVLSHITNPGQERTLSLAYVSAPRLRREGDEVSHCFWLCISVYLHWPFGRLPPTDLLFPPTVLPSSRVLPTHDEKIHLLFCPFLCN